MGIVLRVSAPPARQYHHGNLRETLLRSAEDELRRGGVDALSLRELARAANVSHAAPRRHFTDRQDLLDALAENGFARLDADLRDSLADASDSFPSRLRAAFLAYVRFATENAALVELMYASKHGRGPAADRIMAAADAPFGLMNNIVVQGQSEGRLPAGEPERTGLVVFASMQGIAAMVNGGMIRPEHLGAVVDDAIGVLLRGTAPPR